MTPRVKPQHTLGFVFYWLWYCRATALSALSNLTLLLGKNTLPFPVFSTLKFVSPPHRRAYYTTLSKPFPNKTFPHQQGFFPIKSATSSTARKSCRKIKLFVQDSVPIRTALVAVVVVVVFTLKAVPISTQYFLTSVLVQLTRTPSVVTG